MAFSISKAYCVPSLVHLEIPGAHFKIDERDNQVNMIQRSGGHVRVRQPIKKKYLVNQEQIELIVGNYETYKANNEIDKYLRAISYKIKLYKENDPREEEEESEVEEDEEQDIGGDDNDL